MIEEALLGYLRKEKIEPQTSKNKYKIKFTRYAKDEFNPEVSDNVEICIRIMVVPDQDMVCVEFSKLNGRQTTFQKYFEHLKNDVLSFANDSIMKV